MIPRLPFYALPALDPAVKGQYKGVRNGINITVKDTYINFSQPNFTPTTPVKVMDVSESYFLRAEGVLKGWNMGAGTSQQFYENGVKASFKQVGASGDEAYLNNSTLTSKEYIDPKNPANNSPALSTITIKWQEGDTPERKLERIITQKWIAMYPEGREGWAEFRRTGFPKLFPNVVNNSGGKIPPGEFIKRLTYPTSITNASKAAVDEAVGKFLDGADSPFTAIWWDID